MFPFLTGLTITDEIKSGNSPAALFQSNNHEFVRLIPRIGNDALIEYLEEIIPKMSHSSYSIKPEIHKPLVISGVEIDYFVLISRLYSSNLESEILLRKKGLVPFSEDIIQKYFFCILNGLKEYHHRNIYHGGISLSSIIIDGDNNKALLDMNISNTKGRDSNVCYKAPELYGRCGEYALSSDIWSIGILLYYMCCLKPPFYSIFGLLKWYYSDEEEEIDLSEIEEKYSSELLTIIRQCLNKKEEDRPTIDDLLSSQYVIVVLERVLTGIKPLDTIVMSHSYEQVIQIQLSLNEIRQGEGSRGLDRIASRCPNLLVLAIGNKQKKKDKGLQKIIQSDCLPYEDAKVVAELLLKCPKLTEFYAVNLGLGENGVSVLCEAVLKCPNITTFYIGYNGAEDSTKVRYARILSESREWKELWV